MAHRRDREEAHVGDTRRFAVSARARNRRVVGLAGDSCVARERWLVIAKLRDGSERPSDHAYNVKVLSVVQILREHRNTPCGTGGLDDRRIPAADLPESTTSDSRRISRAGASVLVSAKSVLIEYSSTLMSPKCIAVVLSTACHSLAGRYAARACLNAIENLLLQVDASPKLASLCHDPDQILPDQRRHRRARFSRHNSGSMVHLVWHGNRDIGHGYTVRREGALFNRDTRSRGAADGTGARHHGGSDEMVGEYTDRWLRAAGHDAG